MDHVDSKFIGIISSRLSKFKRVKSDLYTFRCPICGDSKKSKSKTRGYLYSVKSNINFKCHNCGASMSFNSFLKHIDIVVHKQYTMEKFKQGHTGRNFVTEEPKFTFEAPKFTKKIDLPKASNDSRSEGYLIARKLDSNKFYFAEHFKKWVNSIKHTFSSTKYDESRVIIPLFYNQNLVGVQGRTLEIGNSKVVKYITVMFNDDAPKIYGLDDVNKEKTVYVTEGPFDSTCIQNTTAMCGADADISDLGISDPVYIYDNEPRNREIVDRISKCITKGDKVVIWPSSILEKDINDMVMSGLDVQSVIESNTYQGLEAKLKFTTWKKI